MKISAAKFFAITATALVALNASPVHAQASPSKPITLVVSLPPGGGTDASARPLALHVSNSASQGSDMTTMTPDQFAKLLAGDIKRWAEVTKVSGARLD